jgi:hypothetical protein
MLTAALIVTFSGFSLIVRLIIAIVTSAHLLLLVLLLLMHDQYRLGGEAHVAHVAVITQHLSELVAHIVNSCHQPVHA